MHESDSGPYRICRRATLRSGLKSGLALSLVGLVYEYTP
jgi:hypothetical protein